VTTDLAFTVFRIGFLVLLWLLVLAAVNTLRRDIFGTVVTPRGKGRDKATSRRKASREKRKDNKKRTSTNPLAPKDLLVTGGPPGVSPGRPASLPSTGAWRVGPTEWKEIPASDSCPPRSPAKVGEPDWTKNVPKAGYCASTSAPMDEALETARSKVASSVPAARFTA